jgi:hypothetical protein
MSNAISVIEDEMDIPSGKSRRLLRVDLSGKRFLVLAYYFPKTLFGDLDKVKEMFGKYPYLMGLTAGRLLTFVEIDKYFTCSVDWGEMYEPSGYFITKEKVEVYVSFL